MAGGPSDVKIKADVAPGLMNMSYTDWKTHVIYCHREFMNKMAKEFKEKIDLEFYC